MTLKQAKKIVTDLGLTLTHNVEWEEFIVRLPWERVSDNDSSYHTTDLDDAVNTAKAMASTARNRGELK